MTIQEEYTQLGDKLSKLGQQRAVLLSKEADKADERQKLEAELKAAGVDTSKLDEEAKRLEAEINEAMRKARTEINTFETRLAEAASPIKS